MALVRYNPLNNFVPSTFADLVENFVRESSKEKNHFSPAVDIFRDENEVSLHFIIPGVQKEDIKIDLQDNLLSVSGSRKIAETLKNKKTNLESHYGEFKRSFKLSNEVDVEKIDAKYDEGILKLTLPLAKKSSKVIEVK